ncbi:glycerol-3-phosphate 1-O-acyltransferase PlsY [Nisaea acidiphila]|uniref:Glycerol-3-phosphate acyltransferase n=1 Tax=Nisaea acidiphila TaxID=1862145 RepID=A0A9J7AWV9_9PROT|nr:glycerol-3-phosphate 1-O-acyltransferase PlsY [Nisaea acidiphila]UUX50921.1 glycerol-3-phosphate 1-O-acyltransferase PlsY [Nisaea acidiphila]
MPDLLGSFEYTWPFYACALAAYLLGSIPFGLVFTRLAGLGDVRKIGSGSIGATNVLRTGNKLIALATLICDAGKGAAAVLIAARYGPDMAVIAAACSLLGHCFPVWLKFKGGKGVATAFGTLIALSPAVAALAGLTWLAMAVLFRYSSLSALTACLAAPSYMEWLVDRQHAELAAFMAVLIFIRHHANIRRLLKGEESKINLSKKKPAA